MKILLIIIVFLVSIHNRIYAQDCPTGGGPWSSQSTSYDDRYFNQATVGYDYRSIGGSTYEIRINWSTLTNISEFLSDSTMMKILEMKAVKNSIPQIDKYTGKVRVYYEKQCKAKIRSIIRVDQSAEVCCPEGMNVLEKIYTRMINGQTYSFVDVFQYLSCGTKCCYREYNVTCNYDDVYNFFVYDVSVPTTYSVNSCSTMSSYVDCLDPNLPIPCVDGDCEE